MKTSGGEIFTRAKKKKARRTKRGLGTIVGKTELPYLLVGGGGRVVRVGETKGEQRFAVSGGWLGEKCRSVFVFAGEEPGLMAFEG